jgi:hypothetical protein
MLTSVKKTENNRMAELMKYHQQPVNPDNAAQTGAEEQEQNV